METSVKVGVIGVGNIFPAYVKGCRDFDILELAACADIDMDLAKRRAEEFDIPAAMTVEELLADPEIQIIVNLTVPKVHAEVSLKVVAAGKHVYSEKPLAVAREDGQRLIEAARQAGVRVGCAPDTFLGGGHQTCRKLLDDGWIGEPVAAVAFFAAHGPESWHPNPDFFYQVGGGPLFDVGPYYLTSLIDFLGPVRRVTGSTRISFPERVATSEQHFGRRIPVETPTHIAGVLDFASGPIATLIASFDMWDSHLPRIEIYGSEGSLSVPDPNIFGGPVQVRRAGASSWSDIPFTHSTEVGRGIGVAELAYGITYDRPHRASGELAFHVLDIMHAIGNASQEGRHQLIESTCTRPDPLPLGLLPGRLNE